MPQNVPPTMMTTDALAAMLGLQRRQAPQINRRADSADRLLEMQRNREFNPAGAGASAADVADLQDTVAQDEYGAPFEVAKREQTQRDALSKLLLPIQETGRQNQAIERIKGENTQRAAQTRADAVVQAAQAAAAAKQKPVSSGTGSPYAVERTARARQAVHEILPKVGAMTAGVGSLLSNAPGTSARDLAAQLTTLKSSIAFNELTAMREASKTGGALGQVSDAEEKMLSSALGGLDQGQSPANLQEQLKKIDASLARWQQAQRDLGADIPEETDTNVPDQSGYLTGSGWEQ